MPDFSRMPLIPMKDFPRGWNAHFLTIREKVFSAKSQRHTSKRKNPDIKDIRHRIIFEVHNVGCKHESRVTNLVRFDMRSKSYMQLFCCFAHLGTVPPCDSHVDDCCRAIYVSEMFSAKSVSESCHRQDGVHHGRDVSRIVPLVQMYYVCFHRKKV